MSVVENEMPASSEVAVDESVYPIEIGKSAAFLFTDRARVDLYRKAEASGSYFVRLTPKKGGSAEAETLATDFANELLNTSLKEAFTEKFADMREEIIVAAISNSLKEAMVTVPDAPVAAERSIDEVLGELAKEFDLKKSENKIDEL